MTKTELIWHLPRLIDKSKTINRSMRVFVSNTDLVMPPGGPATGDIWPVTPEWQALLQWSRCCRCSTVSLPAPAPHRCERRYSLLSTLWDCENKSSLATFVGSLKVLLKLGIVTLTIDITLFVDLTKGI